ncbi:MAG: arsenate reductase ArsC [Thermodesulfobacteriota bacterium]
MEKKKKVLFLCTRNSCRSQMAEGFLRALAGDRFEVFSAGMDPSEVHPLAIRVMKEVGVDISNQRSKGVKEFLGRHVFAHIFTVCEAAHQRCPSVYPSFMNNVELWRFEDPEAFQGTEEERIAKFREVRDQILAKIRAWLAEKGSGLDS